VDLRPATAEDREFLFGVFASTRDQEMAAVPWTPEQKDVFLRMQFQAQDQYYRAQYPGSEFLVILAPDGPAGRLYVYHSEQEILLLDISLLPAYRKRGLGTRLLQDLQAESRTAGKPLRIHVERMNPALTLYERLGFRRIEDQGVYWYMEWRHDG